MYKKPDDERGIGMSGMILCRTREADIPYHIDGMDVDVYSLEELCYYIYNNIYVLELDMINAQLLSFIREDIGEHALADRIEYMLENKEGLAKIVVTFLTYVDYYSVAEIEEIKDILNTLNNQNVSERLKSRADSYLGSRRFYKAIETYYRIINGRVDTSLPGLFYAKVYHNTGVAYAKLFLYRQAAEYFREAYRIGQHEESRRCYVAAMEFSKGEDSIENIDENEIDPEILKLRREVESYIDNARYSEECRNLQKIEGKKADGLVAEYYNDINETLGNWKEQYKKFTQ